MPSLVDGEIAVQPALRAQLVGVDRRELVDRCGGRTRPPRRSRRGRLTTESPSWSWSPRKVARSGLHRQLVAEPAVDRAIETGCRRRSGPGSRSDTSRRTRSAGQVGVARSGVVSGREAAQPGGPALASDKGLRHLQSRGSPPGSPRGSPRGRPRRRHSMLRRRPGPYPTGRGQQVLGGASPDSSLPWPAAMISTQVGRRSRAIACTAVRPLSYVQGRCAPVRAEGRAPP
jgi:hypothetical protein